MSAIHLNLPRRWLLRIMRSTADMLCPTRMKPSHKIVMNCFPTLRVQGFPSLCVRSCSISSWVILVSLRSSCVIQSVWFQYSFPNQLVYLISFHTSYFLDGLFWLSSILPRTSTFYCLPRLRCDIIKLSLPRVVYDNKMGTMVSRMESHHRHRMCRRCHLVVFPVQFEYSTHTKSGSPYDHYKY